ncbi:tubulin folding cofactor b, putative [Ichthyophthirius multifiliis]|uniref:Tubulin folding cofactor b, putative n=1 Tax=Ichthyophthirius multifiliis TaxID=5932 RepID=G0QQW5_ICHMU|nr:tubulin folding cofactor b, putative [Ichthyophthirius multifiliis]EGR32395.1 tubulin folding cofactor b, putative [Ichthyophthirius multifiliis]|eukprot:XP_004035881.1 tubulin folding cofactor b, putative [Ichthyophthirius multifiliis]
MHSVQYLPGQGQSIKLNLSHNISENKMLEVRFELNSTISQVKQQIEKRYGTSSQMMQLVLEDSQGNKISSMNEDNQQLGYYNPQDNYTIHVIDLNPHSVLKDITDVNQVKKYQISEEDYDKIPDNFRKFKQKIDQNNPNQNNNIVFVEDNYLQDFAEKMHKNDRCQIINTKNRGTIQYIGKIPDLGQGYYIGIQLDEPIGKNNGSYNGVKYFNCQNKYGLFIRPDKIETGDFPELDLDDLYSDDEI